jgi:hypothetical protein
MATTPEAALYQRLKENMPTTTGKIVRIETRVGLGLPDCLVGLKNYGWVMLELKVVKRGKRVRLSPHQISFHTIAAGLGVPSFILVQYHPPGSTTIRGAQLMLFSAADAIALHEHGIDGVQPVESWPADSVRWSMLFVAMMT